MATRRPRVLVVEDDLVIRFDVADTLRDAGYAVIEAESGDHGLQLLKSGIEFDLVCSDIRIPGSYDGNELARAIKATHPSIKVILMSGAAVGEGMPPWADGFLLKPFDTPQLLALVADMLIACWTERVTFGKEPLLQTPLPRSINPN